jgi:hypothetical protein
VLRKRPERGAVSIRGLWVVDIYIVWQAILKLMDGSSQDSGTGTSRIDITVGAIVLSLSRVDAAAIAGQLADAGILAKAPVAGRVLILDDHHKMWLHHSGGSRHSGPDWQSGDDRLAEAQYRLPPLTAKFHRALVDHPGQLLSVEDLAEITDGALSNSRVIAGALAGYVQWCERLDRRFPYYWWEGRDGESTRYAMQPRVAALFRSAASKIS